MGSSDSKPRFTATNYVLDYSVNLMHPDRFKIVQRNGPSVEALPEQGREQILKDFKNCLSDGNPELITKYAQQRQYSCLNQGLSMATTALGSLILIIGLILDVSICLTIGIVILLLGVLAAVAIHCCVASRLKVLREQWRTEAVSNLRALITAWKQRWPALTFSIIYPVEVWRDGEDGRDKVAIWCMSLRT